jgi:seryl-tRNA synthetase
MDDVLRRAPQVATLVAAWRSVDERRRKLQGELDTLRQARNTANERMAKLDKKSPDFAAARDEMKALSNKIKEGEGELGRLEAEAEQHMLVIPNAPHTSVPPGASEADNPVLHTWGEKPSFGFTPKPHDELGRALGVFDFEGGVRIAGTRFTVLRGAASRLNRALLNYMLDLHGQHGYEEA